MTKNRGFTLIEIAIVLVIVGLLLGSILKGQELIVAARVRNVAVLLDGSRLAYLTFQDRYRMLPGDMPTPVANSQIPGNPGGCTGGIGCGNGRIDDDEIFVVWAQLSRAGFIFGTYNGLITDFAPTATNNPINPLGGFVHIVNDARYDDSRDPFQSTVLNIKTGGSVPVSILAEIDRKIDDGLPLSGYFRSAGSTPLTGYDGIANCTLAGPTVQWNAALDSKNCGGVAIQ
ncbi:MAG: type II secretion system protein [Burkholderiales bacterium]